MLVVYYSLRLLYSIAILRAHRLPAKLTFCFISSFIWATSSWSALFSQRRDSSWLSDSFLLTTSSSRFYIRDRLSFNCGWECKHLPVWVMLMPSAFAAAPAPLGSAPHTWSAVHPAAEPQTSSRTHRPMRTINQSTAYKQQPQGVGDSYRLLIIVYPIVKIQIEIRVHQSQARGSTRVYNPRLKHGYFLDFDIKFARYMHSLLLYEPVYSSKSIHNAAT